jgi:hypothetical protein
VVDFQRGRKNSTKPHLDLEVRGIIRQKFRPWTGPASRCGDTEISRTTLRSKRAAVDAASPELTVHHLVTRNLSDSGHVRLSPATIHALPSEARSSGLTSDALRLYRVDGGRARTQYEIFTDLADTSSTIPAFSQGRRTGFVLDGGPLSQDECSNRRRTKPGCTTDAEVGT